MNKATYDIWLAYAEEKLLGGQDACSVGWQVNGLHAERLLKLIREEIARRGDANVETKEPN
jgi:hypothetical protein